jgi:hypothetical protein
MPRYFFSVKRAGLIIPDREGDELPDLQAARELARATVDDMRRLPHVYGEMREWQKDEFVITDEAGATVLTIPFAAPPESDP